MTKKRSFIARVLISICVPLAVALVIMAAEGIYPFGGFDLVYSDGHQHTPMLYYVWDVLHGQKSPLFDWDLAYGSNMVGVASHFGLYSPLNLIYLFVPRSGILQSLSWMFLLRIALMSATMYFFLTRCFASLSEFWKTLICSAYALSSWVFHYACFTQWMDEAIWFPLVLAFMTTLLREKRGKTPYCLTLTLMLITNFQQSYQILLFAVIYSGLYLFIVERDKGERREKILLLGIYTFLSIGLSSVILLPAAMQIMSSSRMQGSLLAKLLDIFYTNAYPTEYAGEKLLLVRGLWIFWAVIVVVLAACMARQKACLRDRHVIFSLALMTAAILPVWVESIHKVWQGGVYFSFPLRNGFILSFCTLLCFAFTLTYAADIFRQSVKRERLYAVALLAIVVLWSSLNGVDQFSSAGLWEEGQLAAGEELYTRLTEAGNTPMERVKLYEDDFPTNCCFVGAIATNSNFMGVPVEAHLLVNRSLGYGQAGAMSNEIGGTAFSDALCGYKYAASLKTAPEELWAPLSGDGDVRLYENRYAFPTGFFTSTDETVEYLPLSPFDNQNSLSRALLGRDLIDIRRYPQSDSEISLDIGEKSAVYLYIPEQGNTPDTDVTVLVTSASGREPFSADYATWYTAGTLCLGVFENETMLISLDGQAANDIQIGILQLDTLQNAIPKERVMSYTVGKRSLSLDVRNTQQGQQTLFLPINNSVKGWSCTVNGEGQDISVLGGEFMGIEVPGGDSTVELLFTPPGLKAGLALTGLSFLLLLLLLLRPLRGFWSSPVLQSTALAVFSAVFFGLMVFAYAANLAFLLFYALRGLL